LQLRRTAQDATQTLEVENIAVSLETELALDGGMLTLLTAFEHVEITARGDVAEVGFQGATCRVAGVMR